MTSPEKISEGKRGLNDVRTQWEKLLGEQQFTRRGHTDGVTAGTTVPPPCSRGTEPHDMAPLSLSQHTIVLFLSLASEVISTYKEVSGSSQEEVTL